MPTYGIRTQKSDDGKPIENRYFISRPTMDSAQDVSGDIVLFEKSIFSTAVAFDNVHIWEIGAPVRRFRNVPLSGQGTVDGVDALAPELVVRVTFGTDDSNPYYKDYRTRVRSTLIVGTLWTAPYLAILSSALEELDTVRTNAPLTTKAGVPLGPLSLDTHYRFRQLHPRWYNRKPAAS